MEKIARVNPMNFSSDGRGRKVGGNKKIEAVIKSPRATIDFSPVSITRAASAARHTTVAYRVVDA